MSYLRRYGLLILVVLAILFPFVFYSSEMSARKELSLVERVVAIAGKPVQWLFSLFTENAATTVESYVSLRSAKEDGQKLKEENAQLQVRIQMLKEFESENTRLRQLLNFVKHLDIKFVSGEIKSADPTFLYKSVRLNRGEAEGVLPGMAVVGSQGTVGVVMRTMDSFSDVLLITDPNSDLDVIVARNRRRGVVEGTFGNKLRFKFLDRGSRVQVGDEVITSGLTGSFPRGISVGTVSEIGPSADGVTQTIEVEPSVNISQLTEALILLQPSREVEVIRKIGGTDWMKKIMESSPGKIGGG